MLFGVSGVQVDPTAAAKLIWSQPKQTGDTINDAMCLSCPYTGFRV